MKTPTFKLYTLKEIEEMPDPNIKGKLQVEGLAGSGKSIFIQAFKVWAEDHFGAKVFNFDDSSIGGETIEFQIGEPE